MTRNKALPKQLYKLKTKEISKLKISSEWLLKSRSTKTMGLIISDEFEKNCMSTDNQILSNIKIAQNTLLNDLWARNELINWENSNKNENKDEL